MKLSAEELEKIKQSNKSKDLHEILKEEQDKKDDGDGFFDSENNDGGDQNFISDKKENFDQKIKNELGDIVAKLGNVKPDNNKIRSLNNEVGGLEVDYKKIKEIANQDIDVWDDQTKKITQQTLEDEHQDAVENESFIHGIKAGLFGRKGKKRKHLGQVDLGKAAEEGDKVKPLSFVEKLTILKEDRSHNKGGGISF